MEDKQIRNSYIEVSKLVNATLIEMQQHGFTKGEVNLYIKELQQKLQQNERLLEEAKPFILYEPKLIPLNQD